MDDQLRLDLQGVIRRTYDKGFKCGHRQAFEDLRMPFLAIAVGVFALGIIIGAFIL